jgi:hypothetical protein
MAGSLTATEISREELMSKFKATNSELRPPITRRGTPDRMGLSLRRRPHPAPKGTKEQNQNVALDFRQKKELQMDLDRILGIPGYPGRGFAATSGGMQTSWSRPCLN